MMMIPMMMMMPPAKVMKIEMGNIGTFLAAKKTIMTITLSLSHFHTFREGEDCPVDYSDQPPDHPAPSLPLEVIRSQNTPSYR